MVDVFGTVRTARFLYNVTASSRLGFLRRHRPSTYYVGYLFLRQRRVTPLCRSLSLSLSRGYLLSRFFDIFSLALLWFASVSFFLSFLFTVLSICLPRYGVRSPELLFVVVDV